MNLKEVNEMFSTKENFFLEKNLGQRIIKAFFNFYVLILFLTALSPRQAASIPSSSTNHIRLERVFSTPYLWGTAPSSPVWSNDSRRLAFLWNDKGNRFMDIWLVDADTDTLRRLTSMKPVRPDPPIDDKRTEEEKKIEEKMERGVSRLAWSPDGRKLAFIYIGDIWAIDITDPVAKPKGITHTANSEDQPTFSPDGRWLAFRSSGDIIIFNLAEPEIIQLTRLAKGRDIYITDYEWAPAGMRIALALTDRSKVEDSPIPDYLSPEGPSLSRPKRVFPGKEGPQIKLGVVNVPEEKLTWIDPGKPQLTSGSSLRRHWSPDGHHLLIDASPTDQKHRWLLVADIGVSEGHQTTDSEIKAKEIFHETDVTNYWGPVLISDWSRDGQAVIFVSDNDGDYHLYRIPASGGEPAQLTKGAWQVLGIGIPQKSDGAFIYFTSTMASPSEVQLYRVDSVKGGNPERLTQAVGTHQTFISPDGKRFATISDLLT